MISNGLRGVAVGHSRKVMILDSRLNLECIEEYIKNH